jgi:hypothetical protein
VRRFVAYRLLSSLRSRDYRDLERVVRQLGEIDGVTISEQETLLVGRRRLLETLMARPRTPETLWPIAALSLTYELEYLSASPAREDLAADARDMAQRLAELVPDAEALAGRDAALKPLLLYGRAIALMMAQEFAEAEIAAQDGAAACNERVWASSSLCLDVGLAFGYARLQKELRANDPTLMDTPSVRTIGGNRYELVTETRCRAVIVGDVDDAGNFVNARVPYENPPGICRNLALQYAGARNYPVLGSGPPGVRRRNIILRFVLTSP